MSDDQAAIHREFLRLAGESNFYGGGAPFPMAAFRAFLAARRVPDEATTTPKAPP